MPPGPLAATDGGYNNNGIQHFGQAPPKTVTLAGTDPVLWLESTAGGHVIAHSSLSVCLSLCLSCLFANLSGVPVQERESYIQLIGRASRFEQLEQQQAVVDQLKLEAETYAMH